jgi:hypothetical protein
MLLTEESMSKEKFVMPTAAAPAPEVVQAARKISRDSRKPFGSQDQKLAYPTRENYHRHWFNELPGRIDSALEAGYTHVLDKEGRKVVRIVGVANSGDGLPSYLMEIPQEWYDDDMARQQAEIDKTEEAMRRGKLEEKPGENRYIPAQGISIKSGR